MRRATSQLFLMGILFGAAMPTLADQNCTDELNFVKKTLQGDREVNLCEEYRGKVLLVVNTASKCGFTPQYEGLEALYRKYKDRGLVVLGFPSNDFGAQEPGTAKQIQEFCKNTYGVEFPMFEKTSVTERNADPMYRVLGSKAGEYPQWNFHKYLIGRDGKLVASFPSREEPTSERIVKKLESVL